MFLDLEGVEHVPYVLLACTGLSQKLYHLHMFDAGDAKLLEMEATVPLAYRHLEPDASRIFAHSGLRAQQEAEAVWLGRFGHLRPIC